MIKLGRFIAVLALSLAFLPSALAAGKDEAIRLRSADLEVKQNSLRGSVRVCNIQNEDIGFTLEAVNLNINGLYKRDLFIPAATCRTYKLDFTNDFALMSNADDHVQLVAKNVITYTHKRKGSKTTEYRHSNKLKKKVEERDKEEKDCSDQKGKRSIFNVCVGDFIYHEPTGLRIRIIANDKDKVDLMVTHLKWGGVKKIKLYKNRTKQVIARNDKGTRVELSNLAEAGKNNSLYLKVDAR